MHSVVDMMRTDPDEDPDLSEVLVFIKELITCWQLLDSVSVSPSLVLSNAASPISTPTYMLSQSVQQEEKKIASQADKVTTSDVLQVANSYEG